MEALSLAALLLLGLAGPARAEAPPLTIPLAAATVSLDPTLIMDQSSLWVSRQLNCQLVRLGGAEVVNEAAAAIAFHGSDRIEITLKDDVFFADGSPVTADDVVTTFEFLRDNRHVYRTIFNWVQSIEAKGPRVVAIRLKKAVPQFMRILASPTQSIFPRAFIQRAAKDPSAWNDQIGCGAYRIHRRSKDGAGRPVIELEPIRPGSRPVHFILTGTGQVEAGSLARYDIIGLPVAGSAPAVERDFELVDLFDPYQIYFAVNTKVEPWTDRKARCRLLDALDPKAASAPYGALAETPTDWFPRGILGYVRHEPAPRSAPSGLQGALSGRPFCLAQLAASIPEERRADYQALVRGVFPGARAELIKDAKSFGVEFRRSGCDAIVFGLKSGYMDGYDFLQFFIEPSADVTNWSDDRLLSAIRSSQDVSDAAKRARAYQSIAQQIERLCLAKPLVTIPNRRVLLRKSLRAPNIGRFALNNYALGEVR